MSKDKMDKILDRPQEQRNLEIAHWSLEHLEDYKPITEPHKPQELAEYELLNKEQASQIPASFWKKPSIENYLKQKDEVKYENKSNREWLKTVLNYLPEKDIINRKRVNEVIQLHEDEPHRRELAKRYTNPKMERYEQGYHAP